MNRWLWGTFAATLAATAWSMVDDWRQGDGAVDLVRAEDRGDARRPAVHAAAPPVGWPRAGAGTAEAEPLPQDPLALPGGLRPEEAVDGPKPRGAAPQAEDGARVTTAGAADAADGPTLPDRAQRFVTRRDPFAGTLFDATPARAPLAAPAAPPLPPRPVLPYTFGGRLVTETGAAALLHDGPRTLVVSPGEELGGFRYEGDAGGHLEFVHLASGERLQLPTRP